MSAAFDAQLGPHAEAPVKPHLHKPMDPRFALGILAVLALGLFYMAYSIRSDIQVAGGGPTVLPFILLGLALLIALGFEFVNGFHDTANAVATVIYTHALPTRRGRLVGVLESHRRDGSTPARWHTASSRCCRWNWCLRSAPRRDTPWCFRCSFRRLSGTLAPGGLGIAASSSHTLIGSIVGVGIAHSMIPGQDGTAGVNWAQVTKVGVALLVSPLVGFALSALLLVAIKCSCEIQRCSPNREKGKVPPL